MHLTSDQQRLQRQYRGIDIQYTIHCCDKQQIYRLFNQFRFQLPDLIIRLPHCTLYNAGLCFGWGPNLKRQLFLQWIQPGVDMLDI